MPDILATLDAVIEEIGQKRRLEFPLFPSSTPASDRTGTAKPLKSNGVPALPVVPAKNRTPHDEAERIAEKAPSYRNDDSEIAPEGYTFKDTGTTGSTGSGQDSCSSETSRDVLRNGKYGKTAHAPTATGAIAHPEIAHLVQHGLVIDFETRSIADLKYVGPFVYADCYWTEVWAACYSIGAGPVRVWRPGDRVPEDLAEHVQAGLPLISHNASFERAIWEKIMALRHHWPKPKLEQWHCTASMAAAMALPRKLEGAANVLNYTFQKDMAGHRLMRELAKPSATSEVPCPFCEAALGEPAKFPDCRCVRDPTLRLQVSWRDDPEIRRGIEYCIQDVETERELLTKLRPLTETERQVWLLDQRINDRGVMVDLPLAQNARMLVEHRLQELNAELQVITGGAVSAATQITKLVEWLRSKGAALPGGLESNELGKQQVKALLAGELPPECRRTLEIRLEAAKTSTAKLEAFLQRTSADGRMRDNLVYHGAGRTGRWSGKGAQLQNVPRPPASMTTASIATALEMIRQGGSIHEIELVMPASGLEIIAACLRPMLIAAPARDFIAADYNAIESRGVAWLAGADRMLGIFARGEDPYRDMASQIYGRPADGFGKASPERQLGKIAVLGLGYQMGAKRFKDTCEGQGVEITEEFAEKVKRIYRDSNRQIVLLWRELEDAAIRAVQNPGVWVKAANGRLGFMSDAAWLYLRLPSGRLLSYANPRYELTETAFGPRCAVTFEGVNSITRKWEKQQAYGGKWCENAVQAICRDLLANAMLNLEVAGYPIVLSVHDEVVAEVPEAFGSVAEFEQIMCRLPGWAEGFPVKAEGWRAKRFQK
jgi:DNA polymerase